MTTTSPARGATRAPATDAHTLTGKRRIAFASFVDENDLPGFLALLRSLARSVSILQLEVVGRGHSPLGVDPTAIADAFGAENDAEAGFAESEEY
jgi:hypothetical protein